VSAELTALATEVETSRASKTGNEAIDVELSPRE
jgi:hypothetical protein